MLRHREIVHEGMLCPSVEATMVILGGGFRYDLIRLLLDRWLSVSELVHITGLPASQVSKDLTVLRTHSLVEMRRKKNFHFYHVSDNVRIRCNEGALEVSFRTLSGDELVVRTVVVESEASERPRSTAGQDSSTPGTKSQHDQA